MLADQEGQRLVCVSRKVGGCVPVNGGVVQQDLTDLRTAIHTKDREHHTVHQVSPKHWCPGASTVPSVYS